MEEQEQIEQKPFSEVLTGLFGDGPVPIAQLFRLSDMAPTEYNQFVARWSQADDARRAIITRHMADLTEENFEVEFAPIFRLCLDDKTDEVKLAALDGLWDSTNTMVIGRIIELMQVGNSADVRKAAAAALAHYILLGEWGQIPARFRDRAANALVAEHCNYENPIALRRATLESLGASSHEQVPELIAEAYEDDDKGMQVSALFAMGNSADLRWLHTVMAEMESPLTEMRVEAARAAGELGSSDALAPLAEMAYDPEADVRVAAITALGAIGGDRARDILQQMLDDEELEQHRALLKKAASADDVLGNVEFDAWDDDWEEDDFEDDEDEDDIDRDEDDDDFDDDEYMDTYY